MKRMREIFNATMAVVYSARHLQYEEVKNGTGFNFIEQINARLTEIGRAAIPHGLSGHDFSLLLEDRMRG